MHEHKKIKAELKAKYLDAFNKIQKLVNDFDPCGFIESGAPIDEYDCLTNQLMSGIFDNKSRLELKTIILHEIEHHFGFPDLTIMLDPEKTEFYNDIENLLDNIDNIKIKPSH
jgi:hypothetical protein